MNDTVFVVVPGNEAGNRIGAVKFRESGYYATTLDTHTTEAECKAHVDILNERLGVPKDVAEAAFAGSMFGWDCPGAKLAVQFFSKIGPYAPKGTESVAP